LAERFILNMAFCGSTLLSRLIDVPGKSLVLKEPRSLADLAMWKTMKLRARASTERLPAVMRFCRDVLHRPFAHGEKVSIKPSNWVNSLLREPVAGNEGVLSLFVTIQRASFLRAVFRGGPVRMQDIATFAWHMASDVEHGGELLREAESASVDEAGKIAHLAMVAHKLQMEAFETALGREGWAGAQVVDFETIASNPFEAAAKASRALQLELHREEIEDNVGRHASRNAKEPSLEFSLAHLKAVDRSVVNTYGRAFDAALEWAERLWGSEGALTALERQAA
jgi:hypothetical protein